MRVFECYCSRLFSHLHSPLSLSYFSPCLFSYSFFFLFFFFLSRRSLLSSLIPSYVPSFCPFPLALCLYPRVPPSRCCSIFKRACSAQVILAAAGEGSDKSLMVEKRVCGTLSTRRQYQLTCRKKDGGRWRKEETGWRWDGEAMRMRVENGKEKRGSRGRER